MRFDGWYIEGFGLFRGYEVRDLPDGLTVLLGPNEAGKSTLLAFIRGVLFGFPDGRSAAPKYPPLRGGQPGGRLFLDSEEGTWTVERVGQPYVRSVYLPDGSAGTQDDLDALLGHADRDVFGNIFAFSLEELESLAALEADSVKERIFAGGVVGRTGRPPREALKTLAQRAGTLLKPRAAAAEINRLNRELKGIKTQIREARTAAQSYPKAVEEREKAAKDVKRLGDALAAKTIELERYRALLDLAEPWSRRATAQEEIQRIRVPEGVTEEAQDRLNGVLLEIKGARTRRDTLREELRGHEERLAKAVVDDALLPVADEVKTLFRATSAYESDLERIGSARRQRESEDDKLLSELERLGPAWDRARVEGFDVSIPTAEEVRSRGRSMREAGNEVNRLGAELERVSRDVKETSGEVSRLEGDLQAVGSPPAHEELGRGEGALASLRASLQDEVAATGSVERAEEALGNARTMLAASVPLPPGVTGRQRISFALFGGLFFLGAAVMAFASQPVPAVVFGVVGALLIGVALGNRRVTPASGPAKVPGIGERVAQTERQLKDRQARLQEIRDAIASEAARLELGPSPSASEVEERALLMARQREARRQHESVSKSLESQQTKLVGLERDKASLGGDLERARSEAEAREQEWVTWCAARGVPEPLSPEGLNDLFTSVGRCKESLARLKETEGELEELERGAADLEERVSAVLSSGHAPSDLAGAEMVAAIQVLHERVREDEETRNNRKGIQTAIDGTNKEMALAQEELGAAEERRDAILKDCEAADEAELKSFVERLAHTKQLQETVGASTETLETRLGKGKSADQMLEELETGDRARWQAEIKRLEDEIGELGLKRDDALRRDQDSTQEVTKIGQSSDVARLETEAEACQHQISQRVARWQVTSLARGLVCETLDRFEKKHQPKVVARASALFKDVTDGHYETLAVRDGELDVVDSHSTRIDVRNLSTGAAQQLYLCLRFGLAEEFAARGTSLPLIMDEVLVNFDPERAAGVARAIAEVSEKQQVLVFSCHPETADMMREARGDLRVIELERFAGSAPIEAPVVPAPELNPEPSPSAEFDWGRAIVDFLSAAGRLCGKSEIVAALGMPQKEWTGSIRALIKAGIVMQYGERRGAQYGLLGG